MVNKNGKWYVQYFGEENEVLSVDEEFVYVQGVETGLPAMIRFEEFQKEFLQKPLTQD